jgi:alpha-beta hydrolase superfamily lysophospholipase
MKRNIPLEPYAKRFLSEDPKVTEGYIKDPGNRKTMTFWESMQSMHVNKSSLMYVDQIPSDMHILCIVGENDKLYKASAAKELMKRIPSPSARLIVLKNRGHIHFETPYIKDDVMNDVTSWLTDMTGLKTAENNLHGEGTVMGKKL